MAMSCTITETTHTSVKKIKAVWVSHTDGTASGTTTSIYDGELLGLTTIPATGGDAPDDNYDVVITDSGSNDVLLGAGANRDTANTEHVAKASLGAVAGSKLTFAISGAGSGNGGTVVLYLR